MRLRWTAAHLPQCLSMCLSPPVKTPGLISAPEVRRPRPQTGWTVQGGPVEEEPARDETDRPLFDWSYTLTMARCMVYEEWRCWTSRERACAG
jgi:hypothetical protein